MHMNTIPSLLLRPRVCPGFFGRHMLQRTSPALESPFSDAAQRSGQRLPSRPPVTPRLNRCTDPAKGARFGVIFATVLALAVLPFTRADVVTDWNAAFEASLLNPSERGPRVPIRTWAIMHAAMFDAVNGIVGKYQPCHVTESAPPGARAEAAAIQAAYTTLSTLRPAFQSAYDAQLESSLAGLAGDQGNSQSIARGRAWGEYVAQQIIAWRANDGSAAVLPPFVGSTAAGYWRHAPLGAAPNAGRAVRAGLC
jgi:hypothetical protein